MRVRSIFEKALSRKGLNIYHNNEVPFGWDWPSDIRALQSKQTRKMTAFDVGANTGQTLTRLAGCFSDIQILSFEPVQSSFEQLEKTASKIPSARAFRVALSDAPGTLRMATDGQSGLNRVLASGDEDGSIEEVDASTIDIFMQGQGIPVLDILKIDVEGFEMNVLRGAKKALSERLVNFVLCECEFQTREDPHGSFFEIFEHLSKRGYRVISFYTGGVDQNGWRFGDVLFKLDSPLDGSFMNSPFALVD